MEKPKKKKKIAFLHAIPNESVQQKTFFFVAFASSQGIHFSLACLDVPRIFNTNNLHKMPKQCCE